MKTPIHRSWAFFVGLLFILLSAGAPGENLLRNPAFESECSEQGIPEGWGLYGGAGPLCSVRVVDHDGGKGALIFDDDPGAEVGLEQLAEVEAAQTYLATARIRPAEDGNTRGAHLQVRFLPSNEYVQSSFSDYEDGQFTDVHAGGVTPAGTTHIRVYVYTHRSPKPKFLVDEVRLEPVDALPRELTLDKPDPLPITTLKDLCIETPVTLNGQAVANVVVPASGRYAAQARSIAEAVEAATGARLEVVCDDAVEIPLASHAIVLGNRSTNRLLGTLYDRYYTLLDLRYPGAGGHVVRSLHNPFGNGYNAILVGGSDDAGVASAAEVLVQKLQAAAAGSTITLGWMAEIRLGHGITVPTDLRGFETWEASKVYRSTGYFGWNSISKRMAMYYMTGDESQAREALRLAFPDAQAKQEIADIDGERIENKDDPLGGPYHYNAHMMILFWDLIEESPVFTDEERLRVTQAFTRQLEHAGIRSAYRGPHMGVPSQVGSRHGQWTALSLYCLGRYFSKYYDDPLWEICMDNGTRHFASLHEHAWVSGENDNLFWYNTAIAPVFTYLVLTGDRLPLENGVVDTLLRGQEILVSGHAGDGMLGSASLGFLHKAGYLTGDGRWLEYRNRTGVNINAFRLGQSFWPEDGMKPEAPLDMAGAWQIHRLPKPMWNARNSGIPLEESFLFASCRTAADATGDLVILDGFNGASRNPYHTLAVLELRLDGVTMLKGYCNQVRLRVDGLVEPKVAMNAALKACHVVGDVILAVGEAPKAPFCTWRRSLVQRQGRYALVLDEIVPREDTENLEVEVLWEAEGRTWQRDPERPHVLLANEPLGDARGRPVLMAGEAMNLDSAGAIATMTWTGAAKKGIARRFVSLAALERPEEPLDLEQVVREVGTLKLPESYEPLQRALAEATTTLSEDTVVSMDATSDQEAPQLTPLAEQDLGSPIADLVLAPMPQGLRLCAAAGATVHVLSEDAAPVRTMAADGPIRMLRWWPEHALLLAGCADEKVIAFDASGARQWVFVSEMDPAVFRAAKTYWFKSAPGHEGIHGLHTGVFLDGKSQALVGSACTLEILDEKGQLLHRMPQFWGKVSVMRIIPGPNDSLNLLAGRKYNGTNTLAIINNRTLNPSPRGFYSVPGGVTHIPGWSAMNRRHIFFEDFDGDGAKEVMTEINGVWNRVTVWSAGGSAMYDASFGPGPSIRTWTMRDIDVADFEGDGRFEIVAATARGMLLLLEGTCQKRWAKRLASPVSVMACVAPKAGEPPVIASGCDNGRIEIRGGAGSLLAQGTVKGTPQHGVTFADEAGRTRVAFATNSGLIAVFPLSK